MGLHNVNGRRGHCTDAFMETESSVFLVRELLEMSDDAGRWMSTRGSREFEAERAEALAEMDGLTGRRCLRIPR